MPRKAKEQPAPGGAVREPVKDMLAAGSDADFKESLPDQTSSEDIGGSPEELKPRRKYTKRDKKESEGTAPVDKRLERAKQKQVGLGAAGLVTAGFTMAGKPLNDQEDEDVGDQFYLISNKIGGNSESWLFIIIYTVCLLAKLIAVRTELGEEVQKWMQEIFQPKEEKLAEPEKQTGKQ